MLAAADDKALDVLGQLWIVALRAVSCGYNLTYGGEGCLGFAHSEETKQRARANKGGWRNKHSPITIALLRGLATQRGVGHMLTPAVRAKKKRNW